MIPAGAVEAAWIASLRNDVSREDLARILEAAAPHMLAGVDSDAVLAILESAGVDKANQFDALVSVQKLTPLTAEDLHATQQIKAAAWDEGRLSYRDDLAGTPSFGTPGYKETPNPYRKGLAK